MNEISDTFETWLIETGVKAAAQQVIDLVGPDVAYYVGGVVRDYYLCCGLRPRDVDLIVDLPKHEVFAQLDPIFPFELTWFGNRSYFVEGWQVDVFPSATPVGVPVTVTDALLCSDLSINALAVRSSSCALLDPAGGIADIRERVARPLRAGWQADHKTRCLLLTRLCRFVERFALTVRDWDEPDSVAAEIKQSEELAGSADLRRLLEAYERIRSRECCANRRRP